MAEFAGFRCPECHTTRPIYGTIITGIMEDKGKPLAYDLVCGCCDFEWRILLELLE